MKNAIVSFFCIFLALSGYAQNELTSKELTSPIMLDFLKNYQEKNGIQKIENGIPFTSELSKRGIQGHSNAKLETENIDNLKIVKPNFIEIMRMPVVLPDEKTHYTMKIINSDSCKLQTIK